MRTRAYEPTDAAPLWVLKERFERELGASGGEDKSDTYGRKLTAAYEERYLAWVERCTEREPGCVIVAETDDTDGTDGTDDLEEPSNPNGDSSPADENTPNAKGDSIDRLAGYVFVLPEHCSLIWDAAVVNELYVREPFRGGAIADALMEAALDHARGQDLPLERVVLDVDGSNDRAGAFYRRHGFEQWGEMVARGL